MQRPICSMNWPYTYGEIGSPVLAASIVMRCGSGGERDNNSRETSSYQALPVANPQPPNKQLTWTASCSSVSNTTSTCVQSLVPVKARVATGCML